MFEKVSVDKNFDFLIDYHSVEPCPKAFTLVGYLIETKERRNDDFSALLARLLSAYMIEFLINDYYFFLTHTHCPISDTVSVQPRTPGKARDS